jgi:hypothetical protein
MTLADRLIDHLQPGNRSEGFGAVVGKSLTLVSLVDRWDGKPITLDDGVELRFPEGCDWHTTELNDGSVQLMFTHSQPVVSVEKGLFRAYPTMNALVLRLGAAAFEAQANLKLGFVPFPPFTLTVSLRGRRG